MSKMTQKLDQKLLGATTPTVEYTTVKEKTNVVKTDNAVSYTHLTLPTKRIV